MYNRWVTIRDIRALAAKASALETDAKTLRIGLENVLRDLGDTAVVGPSGGTREQILALLSEHPMTNTDLQKATGLKQSNIGGHLGRLLEAGEIERVPGTSQYKRSR